MRLLQRQIHFEGRVCPALLTLCAAATACAKRPAKHLFKNIAETVKAAASATTGPAPSAAAHTALKRRMAHAVIGGAFLTVG